MVWYVDSVEWYKGCLGLIDEQVTNTLTVKPLPFTYVDLPLSMSVLNEEAYRYGGLDNVYLAQRK